VTDGSKKKDCLIALNEDTRICWADQETFIKEQSYGKRKYPGPTGQGSAKSFDATGTYSARDMQALNATFANPGHTASLPSEQAKGGAMAAQWTCGQVPPLVPTAQGVDRKDPQLAYAKTLLTVSKRQ